MPDNQKSQQPQQRSEKNSSMGTKNRPTNNRQDQPGKGENKQAAKHVKRDE